jgi:hypothetical protein
LGVVVDGEEHAVDQVRLLFEGYGHEGMLGVLVAEHLAFERESIQDGNAETPEVIHIPRRVLYVE